MQSITFIIFLSICTTTYGLSCLITNDGEPIEVSLEDFDSIDVIDMIENLDPEDYDDGIVCRIELIIVYDLQLMFIAFTDSIEDSELEDQDVRIDIFVNGDEIDGIGIGNVLKYACSDDGCELDFVKKYIDWFIDADYPELPNQLTPWILGDGKEAGE
jgi:hypothetical protein